jgi:hypothetical protein
LPTTHEVPRRSALHPHGQRREYNQDHGLGEIGLCLSKKLPSHGKSAKYRVPSSASVRVTDGGPGKMKSDFKRSGEKQLMDTLFSSIRNDPGGNSESSS